MDTIPENVKNARLYMAVKKLADERYKKPGIWKSSFIVSEYKKRGGTYKDSPKTDNLAQWRREEWIHVVPFLETGKIEICGSTNTTRACRPLYSIADDTPITIPQLLKIHSKEKLLKLAKAKEANPEKTVYWKSGIIK